MNFVQEVAELISEKNSVDARKNIARIESEIKNLQSKVNKYIESNYAEFLPDLSNNEYLLDESDRLLIDVEALLESAKNETKNELCLISEELKQDIEMLEETSVGLRVSFKILKIDKLFQELEISKSNDNPLNVLHLIAEIKKLMDDPLDKILRRLDCFENIKIKYCIEMETMMHSLKQKFTQLVQLNERTFCNTKSIVVKISKNEEQLHDTIIALFNNKYNSKHMCDFLIENVFEPIITRPVSLEMGDDGEFVSLTLSYSLKPMAATNLRPNYKAVFKNIETTFQCLGYMNISISETMCVFSLLADTIKEKFVNMLLNECLNFSIPETMDEMNESTIVEDLTNLNSFLVEMLFFDNKDRMLLEYGAKIEILFKNRFCMNIMDSALAVMRKDLHDMILVAENNFQTNESDPVIFPQCMVSKSTLELINFMEKVLKQIISTDAGIGDRLVSTIESILMRYTTEVTKHHAKLLLNIPQQTALFHNNTMYLAHWVTRNCDKIRQFSSIAKVLQHEGAEQFLKQIHNQRTQLVDIMKEFDLSDAISELGNGPQKVVRQCLRQLDLLKNVWQNILPVMVYEKSMGNLLNDFCSDIIRKILYVEDLSTNVSNGLITLIEDIIRRAPTIFMDHLKINTTVKCWMKLIQLKMILGASLVQITDQWADGKGPLTLNYKSEEICHLIRALFQNTDRRANALAMIV